MSRTSDLADRLAAQKCASGLVCVEHDARDLLVAALRLAEVTLEWQAQRAALREVTDAEAIYRAERARYEGA